MGQELNVLALLKGEERYVYVYDDASRDALFSLLHSQAADPDLALNGFDAAVLSRKAREQTDPSFVPPSPNASQASPRF